MSIWRKGHAKAGLGDVVKKEEEEEEQHEKEEEKEWKEEEEVVLVVAVAVAVQRLREEVNSLLKTVFILRVKS